MKRISLLLLIIIVGSLTILAGCSKIEQYGEPLSSQEVTQIAKILKDPDGYIGKTVKVEGEIVSECPTGCWFNVTDATGTLYIDLFGANLAIPQKVGSQVVLEGEIKKRSGLPIIHGTGVVVK